MTRPAVIDEAPLSEFVRKMRDVFARRRAGAITAGRADAECEGLMRRYLGRSAWDAMADADTAVPRDTSADLLCRGNRAASQHSNAHVVDRKQLAAGDVD